MPAASRHAKPKTPAIRLGAPVVAAATLAGVAAAFVFLQGGSAAPRSSHDAIPLTSAGSGAADYQMTAAVRHDVAARMVQRAARAARRRHLAAARLARQQAAHQAAAQPPAPTLAPTPSSGRRDAPRSPPGILIPHAEDVGS